MADQARRDDPTKCPKHTSGTLKGIPQDPRCTGNSKDAVRLGDWAVCTTGDLDVIVEGAATVEIGGRKATRVGNKLWHGGAIDAGSPNIDIGGPTITADEVIKAAKDRAKQVLNCAKKRLDRWNDEDKKLFKKWFGSDSNADRKTIQDRVAANGNVLDNAKFQFAPNDPGSGAKNANKPGVFAHVYAADADHNIYLDPHFWNTQLEGTDNQAGTLLHETSHFNDVGGTKDHIYGHDNAENMATTDPGKAMTNADSYEYFMEDVQRNCP